MTRLNDSNRRSFLKIAAVLGGVSTVGALSNFAGAQDTPQQTNSPAITLQDVALSSGAKLTIERRGQIVLFGINRPYIQNRIDPETFEKLAEAYYQYDQDPSLRAAILFGHGENFSRGIDVQGFKSLAGMGKPWIASTGTIDPLAKRAPSLSKPLIVVTQAIPGIWRMRFPSLRISGLHLRTLVLDRTRTLTADFQVEDRPCASFVKRDGEMPCVTC